MSKIIVLRTASLMLHNFDGRSCVQTADGDGTYDDVADNTVELTCFTPVAGVSCHARAIVCVHSVDTRRSVQALTGVTFVDVCVKDATNLASI